MEEKLRPRVLPAGNVQDEAADLGAAAWVTVRQHTPSAFVVFASVLSQLSS